MKAGRTIKRWPYLLNGGLIPGQQTLEADLASEKSSDVSAAKTFVVSAATKAATAATSDISIPSTTPWGEGDAEGAPSQGAIDSIEMSDVAADVAAVAAFLAADTTDVFSAGAGGRRSSVGGQRPTLSVILGWVLQAPSPKSRKEAEGRRS